MVDNVYKFFGFEIQRAKKDEKKDQRTPSIVPPNDEDGAGYVTASGAGHFGQYVDLDGDKAKDNAQMIMKYRGVALQPECDMAIEDIVNESISVQDNKAPLQLQMDDADGMSNKVKKTIGEEFDYISSLLGFSDNGHDLFRRWYIDGRLVHHIVIDESSPKLGIQELRFMDSIKTRKVREVKWKKDPTTGVKIVDKIEEYFIYQEKPGAQNQGTKLTSDSISYVTSGLLDESRKKVVSYLHKALKPVNQLRMMEDSLVIYRLARAPERRIFYVDVGNLPQGKANEYMKNIQSNFRNKLVYDSSTGQIKDDRKHMSMLEDFWLPRKEGGRGTEISSLPGGDNLGQIEDIIYFQKRLYRSLNVPLGRLETEQGFNIGRSTEISREEVKFQKFIDKIRRRFSKLFTSLLKKQLLLKGIITEDDWKKWENDIIVDFVQDNHFAELKENDVLREKIQTLDMVTPHLGEFFTKEWVLKNVMRYNEEEIKAIEQEGEEAEEEAPEQNPQQEEQPPAAAGQGAQHSLDININKD